MITKCHRALTRWPYWYYPNAQRAGAGSVIVHAQRQRAIADGIVRIANGNRTICR